MTHPSQKAFVVTRLKEILAERVAWISEMKGYRRRQKSLTENEKSRVKELSKKMRDSDKFLELIQRTALKALNTGK